MEGEVIQVCVRACVCLSVQTEMCMSECASCMQTEGLCDHISEGCEAQSLGLKSSIVKIVYGLPKAINLRSL